MNILFATQLPPRTPSPQKRKKKKVAQSKSCKDSRKDIITLAAIIIAMERVAVRGLRNKPQSASRFSATTIFCSVMHSLHLISMDKDIR
jgi:hypothetical protein